MFDAMPRWLLWLAAGATAIAAVFALVIVARVGASPSTEGPLGSIGSGLIETRAAADQWITWGVVLPRNTTLESIEIRSVEVVGSKGLDLQTSIWTFPDGDEAVGIAPGFPPERVTAQPVDGAIMPPSAPGNRVTRLEVLIGMRLSDQGRPGSADGLRVYYRAGQMEFVLPIEIGIRVAPHG